VPVGDAGNAADTQVMSTDGTTGYGSVDHPYKIGKNDVTATQYAAFLNSVAKTDTYGLYNTSMAGGFASCGISRSGSSGNYSYATTKDGNYPVNYVSWGDAARFCNWLSNGQLTGLQDLTTTESGAYALNGATSQLAFMAVGAHAANATYFIPTENEQYKAMYYKSGSTNAGYWLYPTKSNDVPSNLKLSGGTNNANYYNNGYTNPTNYLTAVGYFAGTPGPYGTFDMAGDVWQWNETDYNGSGSWRGLRGGSFNYVPFDLASASRHGSGTPTIEDANIGFRVASVPEPSTFVLLGVGIIGLLGVGLVPVAGLWLPSTMAA